MLVAKYAAVTLSIAVLSIYCAKTVTAQKPPEFNSYRSVTLGMTKDAVRNKLGKPKMNLPMKTILKLAIANLLAFSIRQILPSAP